MKLLYTKTWLATFVAICSTTVHAGQLCSTYEDDALVYHGPGPIIHPIPRMFQTICFETDSPSFAEMYAANSTILKLSENYADANASRTLQEADSYTNAVAIRTLREANSYTDIKTQQAIQEGKNYTDEQIRQLDKRTSGDMAALSALTGIPALNNNKERNIGVALGTYNGETALAIGGNVRFTDNLVARFNIASSLREGSQPVASMGMVWDF